MQAQGSAGNSERMINRMKSTGILLYFEHPVSSTGQALNLFFIQDCPKMAVSLYGVTYYEALENIS